MQRRNELGAWPPRPKPWRLPWGILRNCKRVAGNEQSRAEKILSAENETVKPELACRTGAFRVFPRVRKDPEGPDLGLSLESWSVRTPLNSLDYKQQCSFVMKSLSHTRALLKPLQHEAPCLKVAQNSWVVFSALPDDHARHLVAVFCLMRDACSVRLESYHMALRCYRQYLQSCCQHWQLEVTASALNRLLLSARVAGG